MLPTEVVLKKDVFTDWELCEDEEELEYTLSEYLSDTYGFLHNGFSYKETEDEIIITEIDWEIDDEEDYEEYDDYEDYEDEEED